MTDRARPRTPVHLRALLVGAASVAAWGCGMPGTGSCGLEVFADAHQERVKLDPPYEITLQPPEAEAFQAVVPVGSGWVFVEVLQIAPGGDLRDDYSGPGDMINQGFVAFPIDSPGVWRFQLTDAKANCSREFTVEVRPATGT